MRRAVSGQVELVDERLRIGLASVRNAATVAERMETVERMLAEAGAQDVAIVCFPEAYLPGLRGMDFAVPPPDQERQEALLEQVRAAAERNHVAVIMGMEWQTPAIDGVLNVAFVISREGVIEGYQAKNQIAPSEEPFYVPEGRRRLFEVDGVPFGITICHEGWRFPESVRWSARRGAKVIFHPHVTGSDETGVPITRWGDPDSPYYEKAMIGRAVENTVYFASVNNAFRFQESATTLLGPDGDLIAYVPYGEEALLVHDLDLSRATGLYAKRLTAEFYAE